MILGWCMARQSSPTQAGIRCAEFFGAASDSRSVLDLESGTSDALGGAGATGDTTGMAAEHSSNITCSSITAETSVTADSITVISITVTLAMATLTTAASAMAQRSTVVRAFTLNQ